MQQPQRLDHPTGHLAFTGTGGARKTPLSTACAMALANGGNQVLRVNKKQMDRITNGLSSTTYRVPWMAERPVGIAALRTLTAL